MSRSFVSSDGRRKTFSKEFPHGTRARFVNGCTDGYKGRACLPCTEANRLYIAELERRKKLGIHNGLVSAKDARLHLRGLQAMGMGRRTIAARAGLTPNLISAIRDGRKKQIRRNTEAAILSTGFAPAGRALVNASRTWELLDEMIMLGFPKAWIASQMYGRATHALQLNRDRVTGLNADRVRRLYDRLKLRGQLNRETARIVRLSRHRSSRERVTAAIARGEISLLQERV